MDSSQDDALIAAALGNPETDLSRGITGSVAIILCWLFFILTFPISIFFCFKVVNSYESVVLFQFGRIKMFGFSGGIFFYFPCIQNYSIVDLRTRACKLPTQDILTKDHITVSIEAVLLYRVIHPMTTILTLEDFPLSVQFLAETSLKKILGQTSFQKLLVGRETLSSVLCSMMEKTTQHWGIKIERLDITDVRIPTDLQKVFSCEGQAKRQARSVVIAASGELRSSLMLKRAADVMTISPFTMSLRYLQTMISMSTTQHDIITFPYPLPPSTSNFHSSDQLEQTPNYEVIRQSFVH